MAGVKALQRFSASLRHGREVNFLAVIANRRDNVEGQGKRAATVLQRNQRRRTVPDGVQECFQFGMQRFFGSDGRLRHLNLRIHRRCAGNLSIRADGENQHLLATIIERKILARLEETQFADAFGGNTARGKVSDATGFQFQTDVRNVDFAGENWQAYGTNFLDRGVRECEDDVEIVDHQIEDDVHIKRTRREDAEAMYLKKHRLREEWKRSADRGIEALEMTDLRNPLVNGRQLDKFVGVSESCGQRFLDQYIDAGLHEVASHGKMMNRGSGHRSGTKFTVGGHHLTNGAEGPAAELAGNLVGAIEIGVNHSQQADRFPLLFEFFVDAGVVSSEDAHTHYRNGNWILRWQKNSR